MNLKVSKMSKSKLLKSLKCSVNSKIDLICAGRTEAMRAQDNLIDCKETLMDEIQKKFDLIFVKKC